MGKNGRYNNYTISNLCCQECGFVMPIPRPMSKQRGNGHIKHMYCPICKKEKQEFVEKQ